MPKTRSSEQLLAKPSIAKALIEYQEGSVVSRAIIDKKTGSVTLFAFDENQCLSEHKAPYEALIQVLEGEIDFTISGKLSKLKEGEMIIIPTNALHSLISKTKSKMLLTMIKS